MPDLIKVNKLLFENPELSEREYNSVKILTKELAKHGFKNRIGVGGLETSFESSFECNGDIPAVSFLVEFLKGSKLSIDFIVNNHSGKSKYRD